MTLQESPGNDWRRLYHDLAWVWAVVSPLQEYVQEAEYFSTLMRERSRVEVNTVLALGCGAGRYEYAMKRYFDITGVDASETMLALAREMNPEVSYLAGDMRTVRLGREFDAVTILDSIDYMHTADELRAALTTAFIHLRPGGVFLTLAETTSERFEQNRTQCSTHGDGDIEIAFVENVYDPDPGDTTYEAAFVYLIRRGGILEIETDRHLLGIFSLETWRGLLREVGFDVREMEFTPDVPGALTYPMFVCIRPL